MNPLARRLLALVPALLLVASCGSESSPPKKPAPTPTVGASHHGDIDVLGAVFVMNDDGSATLSAQIVNHLDLQQDLAAVAIGEDRDWRDVRVFQARGSIFRAGQKVSVGGEPDPVRIRFLDVAKHGAKPPASLPLQLQFYSMRGLKEKYTDIKMDVPIVARSATYEAVAGNKPNTAITVEDARITVLPGQRKAYVDGTVTSTIDDAAYELPTAVGADGKPVKYDHQTATGGPYAISAQKGKRVEIGGGPPYKEGEGDADYFDAKDVTVGETITVTIPFQSGDVVVPFKVVAG